MTYLDRPVEDRREALARAIGEVRQDRRRRRRMVARYGSAVRLTTRDRIGLTVVALMGVVAGCVASWVV